MTAPVLRSRADDRRLRRDGFVVVPLIGTAVADHLRSWFLERSPTDRGFHADLQHPDPVYKAQVTEHLDTVLGASLAAAFVDHEAFMSSFVCKFPGADSSLYLHQDWMYVDERHGARTHVAWIALQDVEGDNGLLQVLRGSNRIDESIRGTGVAGSWIAHEDEIRPRLESVPVPTGHAVIFDNALVHCSAPNLSDAPRVAAAVALKPVGTPLVHFAASLTGIERFDIDASFFLDTTPSALASGHRPGTAAEVMVSASADLSAAQLRARLDEVGFRPSATRRAVSRLLRSIRP